MGPDDSFHNPKAQAATHIPTAELPRMWEETSFVTVDSERFLALRTGRRLHWLAAV
jgi:hypothetical protein